MRKVIWYGKVDKCDLCHRDITTIFIDGRTEIGSWALMCPECHEVVGCGIGLGNGQLYALQDGRWINQAKVN